MPVAFESKQIRTVSDDWDRISFDGLLPVGGKRSVSTDFGYLFRHYWTVAGTIRYRTESRQCRPGKQDEIQRRTGERTLVRGDADLCLWREKTQTTSESQEVIRFFPAMEKEVLCEYNRSKQTFRTKPILSHDFWPENEEDARCQAVLRQPVMAPLLPIPPGFRWHVKSDSCQLDYTLESVAEIDGTTVVSVRRKGFVSLPRFYRQGRVYEERIFLDRTGITAFDLNACLVLEDRTQDEIRSETGKSFLDGTEIRTVTKLIGMPE